MVREFKYPSKSNPRQVHTVKVAGRSITCTCRGFDTPNKCWHVRDVRAKLEHEGEFDGTLDMNEAAVTQPHKFVQESFIQEPSGFVAPMLARGNKKNLTVSDFESSHWLMEEKFDGHRLIVRVIGQEVVAWSRNGIVRALHSNVLKHFRMLAEGTYDGELIIPGGTSTDVTDLSKLSAAQYRCFDILKVRDMPIMSMPANHRREMLELAFSKQHPMSWVQVAQQYDPEPHILQTIWNGGGEGVIMKRRDAVYTPGERSEWWVKIKRKQYAILKLMDFEEGRLGPHAILVLEDEDGNVAKVKALNDQWRASFLGDPNRFIGCRVAIDYTIRTKTGKYQQPHADHFPDGEVK